MTDTPQYIQVHKDPSFTKIETVGNDTQKVDVEKYPFDTSSVMFS